MLTNPENFEDFFFFRKISKLKNRNKLNIFIERKLNFYSENKTNWGNKDYLPLAVKHSSENKSISCLGFGDIHLTRKYYACRNFRITEKNISRNRSQVERMINICKYFLSDKRLFCEKSRNIAIDVTNKYRL